MNTLKCTPYQGDELDVGNQFVIWEKDPMPEWAKDQFNFTALAIECNGLPDHLRKLLPQTDSRWRPDQRAFENGDVDLAQTEKERLEDRQRARRRIRSEEDWEPRWFSPNDYSYKGGYWEQRLAGKFTDLPEIFEMELDRGPANGAVNSLPEKSSSQSEIHPITGSENLPKERKLRKTLPSSEFPVTTTTTTTTTSGMVNSRSRLRMTSEDTEMETSERSKKEKEPEKKDEKEKKREKEPEKKDKEKKGSVSGSTRKLTVDDSSSSRSHKDKTEKSSQ